MRPRSHATRDETRRVRERTNKRTSEPTARRCVVVVIIRSRRRHHPFETDLRRCGAHIAPIHIPAYVYTVLFTCNTHIYIVLLDHSIWYKDT